MPKKKVLHILYYIRLGRPAVVTGFANIYAILADLVTDH